MLRFTSALLLLHSAIAQEPTIPPSPDNPPCVICGEGNAITNPEGIVVFPNQPDLTCAQVETAGLDGFIAASFCPFLSSFLEECFCAPTSPSPPTATPAPVTDAPTTPEPTSSEPSSKPSISHVPSTKPISRQPTTPPDTPKPSPQPITPQPTTAAPVIPTSPSPTLNCGIAGKACLVNGDCCSEVCEFRPAKRLGLCLSVRDASKNALKLAGEQGGAGGGGL
jgi:hypothetical protein